MPKRAHEYESGKTREETRRTEKRGLASVVCRTADSQWRDLGAAIIPSKEHLTWSELP
jgi:hypothetical protein